MGAIRCTCILDARFRQVVQDPTCPATLLHDVFHTGDAGATSQR